MKPIAAANQLMKVWRSSCDGSIVFPVPCEKIAQGLGIHVVKQDIDDAFEAALLIRDGKKAIIYNSAIREAGRKNFSIAHELGHHSLHQDLPEIKCSLDDLNDVAPHPQNIEQEANLFAATLLMPADDVREQIESMPISLDSVKLLRDRYATSLTATALRVIQLLHREKKFAVAVIQDERIQWCFPSSGMKMAGCFIKGGTLLSGKLPSTDEREEVDADHWFPNRYDQDARLYIERVSMPYYEQDLLFMNLDG